MPYSYIITQQSATEARLRRARSPPPSKLGGIQREVFIKINQRVIGVGHPCFIIAEAGVNHNGSLEMARQMVDAAVQASADAVKFQSFVTEELVTPQAGKAAYQVQATGETGNQYRMLKALELNPGQQAALANYCKDASILFLSTPYDWPSVDLLDELDVVAYKIASTDTTNVPFLRYIAQKSRPVILSTGMATLGEVEIAVSTLRQACLNDIVILHCTSEYPTPVEEVNLRAMDTLRRAFGYPVGFSDHTAGVGASPWAVALGACVVEKHFTLDRNLPGPDHRASLEPAELRDLVQTIRQVEVALGDGIKRPMPSELPNKRLVQKSLVARRDIEAGTTITEADLTCKRPATGLPPRFWDQVVGRRAARFIAADEILTFAAIDWGA